MSLDFHLSSDQTELRITVSGRLDDDAVVDAYRSFWDGAGQPPLRRMLTDMRGVEGPGLSTQAVRRLADVNQQRLGHLRPFLRSAIVVSDDLHFGIARMYSVYTETGRPVFVTRELAEAEAWLREDESPADDPPAATA